MFNAISLHFQSEGIPEKLADYMSDFLTVKVHHHAVVLAEILREEFGEPDEPYICPDCEESLMKESLHQDIADACDLPIELVNRVMAGQDEVFSHLD